MMSIWWRGRVLAIARTSYEACDDVHAEGVPILAGTASACTPTADLQIARPVI